MYVGCAPGEDPAYNLELIAVWVVVVIYMFWGLAHCCETFLVPALNILCERWAVPESVAGATLMAAGCNAPGLFVSVIGVFLDRTRTRPPRPWSLSAEAAAPPPTQPLPRRRPSADAAPSPAAALPAALRTPR